jgi:isopentenyl diphosphate isomerase/L-lactate dehydrogenase-like FMN-dependent dehydrogenase
MTGLQLDQLVEIGDFEAAARDQLSKMAYDYYASGANDQVTLRENRAAFERILLSPKMLVDVSRIDLTTSVLGMPLNAPFMIAPTAFQRMAHRDGELATARAAHAQGIAMTLSTIASTSLEDVAAEAPEIRWFQVYVFKDRGVTRRLVQRAEAAGYKALALTVDTPKFGRRYADVRNKFHLPPGITVANFADAGLEQLGQVFGESGLAAYSASLFDPTLTWKDVEWLKSITTLPVLVKGVLRADDAVLAMEHGAAGIIVSNHGGRQLDTVCASIDALPRIAEAVNGRVPLLLDGGVRRGTDVLKALALGAQAALIGRPILWGLAVAGQAGVEKVLTILRDEIELAMMLAGVAKVSDITRDVLEEGNPGLGA